MESFVEILNTDPVISWAIPFFLLFMGLEMGILYHKTRKMYEGKDAMASIAMGLGSLVLNLGVKTIAFITYQALWTHFRLWDLTPFWWAWILLFFADDLTFYVHHRSCHEIRLFWAAHVNHHSSQNYNFAVALRQSWGELFHKYIWWLWLPIVGFDAVMIMTMMSISLIYQLLMHTQLVGKLGPLEWILNTPSHHRVHHASNIRYLDRNHAGMLIIWDRLFGTFTEEQDEVEEVVYGIRRNIHTYNPLKIATHAYQELWRDIRKTPRWKDKFLYLIKPPGWSPDGSTLTAKELRAQQIRQEQSGTIVKG